MKLWAGCDEMCADAQILAAGHVRVSVDGADDPLAVIADEDNGFVVRIDGAQVALVYGRVVVSLADDAPDYAVASYEHLRSLERQMEAA